MRTYVRFTEVDKNGKVRNVEDASFQSKDQFYEWLNGSDRMEPSYPDAKLVEGFDTLWFSEDERMYINLVL